MNVSNYRTDPKYLTLQELSTMFGVSRNTMKVKIKAIIKKRKRGLYSPSEVFLLLDRI